MKTLLVVALLALSGIAHAQTPAPAAKKDAAPAKKEAAQPASSPAKKELVGKVLKLQQPAIEALARSMAEMPVAQLGQQIGPVLQARVPADKREAVTKEIQADIKKYLDEAVPLARERAVKLGPTTIGTVLEEKFSEDELKQLVATMESPVFRKFQSIGADMQRALTEKLGPELRGPLEPKVKALDQAIAKRLGINPPANGGAAPAAPAAAPAAPAKAK